MPLIVIVGPSGAGKTTLSTEFVRRGADAAISITSRPPRPGEVNGRDYHFVSREVFIEMEEAGRMLETAEYDGNLYGLDTGEVDRAMAAGNGIAVAVTEINGYREIARIYRRTGEALIGVFVDAPHDELVRRLHARGDLKPERLEARIAMIGRDKAGVSEFVAGKYGPTVETHVLRNLARHELDAFAQVMTEFHATPAAAPDPLLVAKPPSPAP